MCDQDPRYLQLRAMKGVGVECPDPPGWEDRYKLVYKEPYQFNRIKWPEDRCLNFDPEYVKGRKFGTHCAILNDAWTVDMRQTTFKRFNMKDNMFSEREAKFILENAERDLMNVIKQQDALITEISRHGERLGKIKEARDNLESIVKKLKAAMKREEDEEEDE